MSSTLIIVAAPASVLAYNQAAMTIRIPCSCSINVRVRWSRYLDAVLKVPHPTSAQVAPPVVAEVADDGSGWTTLTTDRPGDFVLSVSLTGGFLR